VKIVALTALADLLGLPSLFFTLLIVSIAEDFGVAALLARHSLRVLFFCVKGPKLADSVEKLGNYLSLKDQ
jgi:hypothetical protein